MTQAPSEPSTPSAAGAAGSAGASGTSTTSTQPSFETYYYQAAVEYGQYGPLEEHLEDVLQHRGTYTMEKYAPQVPSLKFVPETGIDIGNWVKNEAEHIIFVYGEIDPWTAAAFEIDPSRDLHAFSVPGASHGANLASRSLPAESRALALEVLERWTGVEPRTLTSESKRCKPGAKSSIFTCHRNRCVIDLPLLAAGSHDRDSPIPSFGWPLMAACS